MPKRQIGLTEAKDSPFFKECRGQEELASYKHWLTIQDMPSVKILYNYIDQMKLAVKNLGKFISGPDQI